MLSSALSSTLVPGEVISESYYTAPSRGEEEMQWRTISLSGGFKGQDGLNPGRQDGLAVHSKDLCGSGKGSLFKMVFSLQEKKCKISSPAIVKKAKKGVFNLSSHQ